MTCSTKFLVYVHYKLFAMKGLLDRPPWFRTCTSNGSRHLEFSVCYPKKSRILETLNLLVCAGSNTDTKKIQNKSGNLSFEATVLFYFLWDYLGLPFRTGQAGEGEDWAYSVRQKEDWSLACFILHDDHNQTLRLTIICYETKESNRRKKLELHYNCLYR